MSTSGGQAITNVPASLPEVDHESGHESDRNAEDQPRKTNLLFPGEQHPILTIEPPSPMPDDHSHSCSKTFRPDTAGSSSDCDCTTDTPPAKSHISSHEIDTVSEKLLVPSNSVKFGSDRDLKQDAKTPAKTLELTKTFPSKKGDCPDQPLSKLNPRLMCELYCEHVSSFDFFQKKLTDSFFLCRFLVHVL